VRLYLELFNNSGKKTICQRRIVFHDFHQENHEKERNLCNLRKSACPAYPTCPVKCALLEIRRLFNRDEIVVALISSGWQNIIFINLFYSLFKL
jgi:hypothetical protein